MPASRTALIAAGNPVVHKGFVNSAPVAHARLAFLGDIFSIPRSLPLANVFSIGDVILLVGAAAMLAGICGCPRVAALDRVLRPRAHAPADGTNPTPPGWWQKGSPAPNFPPTVGAV